MRKGSMKWNGEEEENPPIPIKKQTLSSSPHKWKAEKPPRHACSLSKQNTPIRSTPESHHFASLTPWSIRKTQRNRDFWDDCKILDKTEEKEKSGLVFGNLKENKFLG
ncbi:hypothetical protein CKAN_01051800 [Cinnamomum micranthum f. kanehirae]|uniref:Uncharacterized protein n=1 Tax=Cinnamomum micranthum f. kanehirae TaxID=337451 RepID=A0A443NTH3_9MAGN|nr:hypothetical protein CKAN_01051800 [Cinnamomum micranthum f. kanehirae]